MTAGQRTDDRHSLVGQWLNGLRIQHIAQSRAAARCERRNRIQGTLVVILTTLVGTSIFATLERTPATGWRVLAGLVSAAAAVLAALQTFLRYGELAELHKTAAQRYGRLRRELEQHATSSPLDPHDVDVYLTTLRERWDELDETSPATPSEVYRQARAEVADRPERKAMEDVGSG
jgi:hypothetical protein